MVDFSLSPAQEALRAKARAFALQEVLPVAWDYDHQDQIPVAVLDKAFAAGLINTDLPAAYGGQGLGLLEAALIVEEMAAACPGIATGLFDNSLGAEPLALSTNDDAKARYLTQVTQHNKRVAFATSEPMMGSDVAGMRCKATPDGDGYRLNGTKYWITNGGIADFYTVFATTDPKARHKGICAFVIERDWEGVRVGQSIPKLGQRCSNTVGLKLTDVHVPKANILAEPGAGFVLAMQTFARTRPIIGAFAIGAMRSALDYALDYAKRRRAFGQVLAEHQAIQFKVAEMYQKIEASRLLVWQAAWQADQGQDPTVAASIAKFYASEVAIEVLNDALQIFGGYGYTRLYPIEKLLRDVRLLSIYEGTSEIQRMVVARHLFTAYTPIMPALDTLPMLVPPSPGARAGNAWRCKICGHIHYGDTSPEECPVCFFPSGAFVQVA